MAPRGADLIPVVQKSYDLCAGLYSHVNRFPRAQRGLLGRVILDDALQMLVALTVANRRADKVETLREASGRLDALRITLRLGKHLGFVSNGGYEDLSRGADEVGRMLGGWLKHEQGGAAAQTGAALPGVERAPAPHKRTGGVRYTMRSPTVEKYLRAKLEHPRAIVFVTTGVFCQSFFEDAVECGRGLKQAEAAKLLGVTQPRVSDLMRGRLDLFSVDTLIDMLARLGIRVRVVFSTAKRSARVA